MVALKTHVALNIINRVNGTDMMPVGVAHPMQDQCI
jgi:hypothetical protein